MFLFIDLHKIIIFASFLFLVFGVQNISAKETVLANDVSLEDSVLLSQLGNRNMGTVKRYGPVGTTVMEKGKVEVKGIDGEVRKAEFGLPLFQGDSIFTGKGSAFQASFLDGSIMRLSSNSDFTINEYFFHEKKGLAKSDISVRNGVVYFLAEKISKIAPQNYKIHTTTATVGIRGSAGELVASSGGENGVFTKIRVSSGGHVLEVTSPFGVFVLDDPSKAIELTNLGVTWFDVDAGRTWIEEEEEEEDDFEEEEDQKESGEDQQEALEEALEEGEEELEEREESNQALAIEDAEPMDSVLEEMSLQIEKNDFSKDSISSLDGLVSLLMDERSSIIKDFSESSDPDDDPSGVDSVEESALEEVQNSTTEESASGITENSIEINAYLSASNVIKIETEFDLSDKSYPLPEIWSSSDQDYQKIVDVSWGNDEDRVIDSSKGFKVRNLWMEGEPTPVDEQKETLQEKLGVSDPYAYYVGLTVQSLKEAASSEEVMEIGISSTGIDFSEDEKYYSLAFFPEQGTILMSLEEGSHIKADEYETDITLYSIKGGNAEEMNEGLFFAEDTSPEERIGKFSGEGAVNILSGYDRSYQEEYSYAISNAHRTNAADDVKGYTDIHLKGNSVGVILSGGNAEALIPEDELSNSFELKMGDKDFELEIIKSNSINYLGPVQVKASGDLKILISKDAFFSNLREDGTVSYLSIEELDKENSFIAGVPGLNDFHYIGWGLWAIQEDDGDQRLFGYINFGLEDSYTSIEDMNALKNLGQSYVVSYRGYAMGSVFNLGELPKVEFASTTMDVNFSTGEIVGQAIFSADKIGFIRSASEFTSHSFSGDASLNGGGSGFFKGQFFGPMAKEASGVFNASNGTRHAIGTFGVKK